MKFGEDDTRDVNQSKSDNIIKPLRLERLEGMHAELVPWKTKAISKTLRKEVTNLGSRLERVGDKSVVVLASKPDLNERRIVRLLWNTSGWCDRFGHATRKTSRSSDNGALIRYSWSTLSDKASSKP